MRKIFNFYNSVNLLFFGLFVLMLGFAFNAKAEQKLVKAKNYYASLRSDETNVRAGPGQEYPIKFTFKLRSMPVKVIAEYDNWNEIEDFEGDTGWVNQNLLTKKRTILVRTAKSFVNFYSAPKDKSRIIYRVQNNVIGNFYSCKSNWCNVRIFGKKGWIEKSEIWGVSDEEQIDPSLSK